MVLASVYPIFSIFLSQILDALFLLGPNNTAAQREKGRSDSNTASLVFLLLAVGVFVVTLLRDFCTYLVGE